MKLAMYLVYCLAWDLSIFLGCGYAVFWKGRSGWWFVLAMIVGSCGGFSTETFRALAGLPPKEKQEESNG